jgi:hypothetical protein
MTGWGLRRKFADSQMPAGAPPGLLALYRWKQLSSLHEQPLVGSDRNCGDGEYLAAKRLELFAGLTVPTAGDRRLRTSEDRVRSGRHDSAVGYGVRALTATRSPSNVRILLPSMRVAYSEDVGQGSTRLSSPPSCREWQADAIRRCQEETRRGRADQASLNGPSWRVPRSGMPTTAWCRPRQGRSDLQQRHGAARV